MPAGDYYSCIRCGRTVLGSLALCNDCHPSKAYGISFNLYGDMTNTYADKTNCYVPPKEGWDKLPPEVENTFKEDTKAHMNTLAHVFNQPPLTDKEFEDFWKIYNTINENVMKKDGKETLNDVWDDLYQSINKTSPNSISSTDELADDLYYKMIDDSEEELCDNLSSIEKQPKNKSLSESFDSLFGEASLPLQKKEIKPLKRKTLVVNLFAGPGSGKSTTAAGVFFELKSRGVNCELATEFVKDLVWEERHKAIDNQIYIFAKQHHRITRLLDEVDVIITDSPLLLTHVYDTQSNYLLRNLATYEHNKLWTFNVFVKRQKEFNPKGRMQTYEEARKLDRTIANVLDDLEIPYEVYFGNAEGKDKIVDKILLMLGHK